MATDDYTLLRRTSSLRPSFFGLLGNIEDALTELANSTASEEAKAIVRASIQAYFFDEVLAPNLKVVEQAAETESVLTSYARFLRTLNRILLKGHSSILTKQANIFTTNVDMLFEVAFEQMGIGLLAGLVRCPVMTRRLGPNVTVR